LDFNLPPSDFNLTPLIPLSVHREGKNFNGETSSLCLRKGGSGKVYKLEGEIEIIFSSA
jgi:hypothetical protein